MNGSSDGIFTSFGMRPSGSAILGQRSVSVVAVSSFDTPFPTVKIPALAGFDAYLQLMAGWNILVAAGLAAGVNLDKTVRARKIGNEI